MGLASTTTNTDDECHRSLAYYGLKDSKEAIDIPRISLRALMKQKDGVAARLNSLMEAHSFVVLTDLGKTATDAIESLNTEMESFFITSTDEETRQSFASKSVYVSERGVPMWYRGYERTDVRQAFRIGAGKVDDQPWPTESFRKSWLNLMRICQKICDKSLQLTLKTDSANFSSSEDFSVCYGLCYPNTEGTGQSIDENVYEHIDPSLYVIEPVCPVNGLQVFDRKSQTWLTVEANCRAGDEMVLFGGKALTACTKGRIPGCLHRVERAPEQRMCFIYEQKYAEFFE